MANIIDVGAIEGQALSKPPYFHSTNYVCWKHSMRAYLQAKDYPMWDVIEMGPQLARATA